MYRSFFKRVLDVGLAILSLPIQLLLFLVLAPAIYLEDRGSIFYLSQRRGLNGRNFRLYKYRSMAVNAPEIRNADLSTVTRDDDVRVTKIGRFLRKSSLDEMPQFLNVLLGDMSIVGPRPNLTKKPLQDLDPLERKRISVRPGITGYSQAYFRNSITQAEKYRHDAYYVEHISFRLDCKILAQTFVSVLGQKNINAQ